MTTITCPNCGKPLRPGTRFCGNCGALIPDDRQKITGHQPDSTPTASCPHCGKPIRTGARFCSHCGKEIVSEQVQKPAAPIDVPLQTPVSQPAVPPPRPAGSDQKAGPPVSSRRKSVFPVLIIGVLLLCGLGVVGSFVYFRDPFGWQKKTPVVDLATPSVSVSSTSTAVETTPVGIAQVTQEPPPTSTDSPVATATSEIFAILPLPTLNIEPFVTPTLTGTHPITSAVPTALSSTPIIALEDDFNGPLSANWRSWGDPRPSIQIGPDKKWLDLKAADQPGRAGVTTRIEIENSPGTRIEFDAQLNSKYPLFPLFLDWDPNQFERGPDNSASTIVHFELQKSAVLFQTPAANNRCRVDLDGLALHNFVLNFIDDKKVELFIDHSLISGCTLEMGIKPVSGRISFTGTGWVTRILITRMQSQ